MIAVGALGSCRIHTPLTLAAKDGRIKFKTDSVIGYLHNPVELNQAVALLRGDKIAPAELQKLMNIGNPDALGQEDRFYKLFANVDLMVIEISSLRIVNTGGWSLQINRFREQAVTLGASEGDVSLMFGQRKTARNRALAKMAPEAAKFLERHSFKEMSSRALISEIKRLRAAIDKPVLFIGTLTHDFDGRPINQRISIRNALAEIASTVPHTRFFDPTSMIDAVGAEAFMQDLGHYKPANELRVAEEIVNEIDAFARGDSMIRALQNRRAKREAARFQA